MCHNKRILKFEKVLFPMEDARVPENLRGNLSVEGDVYVHLCSAIPESQIPEPCRDLKDPAIGYFVYPTSKEPGAEKLCFQISDEKEEYIFCLF